MFVGAVQLLLRELDAPSKLSDVGVTADCITEMSRDAMKSSHVPVNPRPILQADVESLYRSAF